MCRTQTQLRSQMLAQLQKHHAALVAPPTEARGAGPGRGPLSGLAGRVLDSMIAEYLAAARYSYTLSIFEPESGLSGVAPLTHEEMLHALRIDPGTPLHDAILAHGVLKDSNGALHGVWHTCVCVQQSWNTLQLSTTSTLCSRAELDASALCNLCPSTGPYQLDCPRS